MFNLVSAKMGELSIEVYNDCGAEVFVYGQEHGPSLVISADSLESAYGIAIDESKAVDWEDLPEAYGFYIMQACHYAAKGALRDNAKFHICSDHDKYGTLTSESILVCNGDRRTIGGPFDTRKAAIEYCLQFVGENEIDLVEGYRYQDNSTDSGIVNTGDYEWLETLETFNDSRNEKIVIVCNDSE